MANKKRKKQRSTRSTGQAGGRQAASGRNPQESGEPGGGQGRRDMVGDSRVYPASGGRAPDDAELRGMASWGQGERGAEGYADAGGSELVPRDGEVLGGLNVGPSGAPITDRPQELEAEGAEEDEERQRSAPGAHEDERNPSRRSSHHRES
ncbi:MAG TPA: hypothetical protein VFW98_18475 [Gemmatimonadaceae bacterium]|nr:hypothetical protein [Gemmatimonadaceae bacterium]